MRKISMSISSKLIFAFASCAAAMLTIGLMSGVAYYRSTVLGQVPRAGDFEWLIVVSATGFLGAVYCGFHLHSVVCSGLGRMTGVFEYIATTLDLSKRAAPPRLDEFGQAALSFDRFMRRVGETVSTVQVSAGSVSVATQQIATGNQDLSVRTEKQAISLQGTASTLAELSDMVNQNAKNARQANTLASDASNSAVAGENVVRTMVEIIERIDSSSIKISEITSVIEGIAFQTNILALNAAVEAARAGEQGRGFAVVASEVRNLAQKAASAAKEIRDLIASSVAVIQAGAKQAVEVRCTMDSIKTSIQQVTAIVDEIAHASGEQGHGIAQVSQSMFDIDNVTQQNAALVEQSAAAAQSLEEQANQLRRVASVFKLADQDVS